MLNYQTPCSLLKASWVWMRGKGFAFLGDALDDIDCQGVGAGFAVRKEDSELRDAMSQIILDMRADGTYKAFNDKYFKVDIYGS